MNENHGAQTDAQGPPRLHAEAIVRPLSHPLLVLDENLTVETASAGFYRTIGGSPSETEGRRLYDIDNGRWDIPRLRALLEQALPEGEEVSDFRVDHESPAAGRRILLLSARRLVFPDQPGRILLSIDDITEHDRAREQLEAQKEFAEKIFDASRDALLVLDTDLRVQQANQMFYDTFKVERDQVDGRLVYELGNGQWDIPRLRELLEHVLPDNAAFDGFEMEHDFEGIGHRILVLNARRIGHLQQILLAIEDVTEQRRSREIRDESEQRFRKALDIETVGVIFWNHDIRISECNQAFLRMSGYSAEEVVGHCWSDLTPPEFFAASENAIAELRDHGLATPYVKQYIRKDGSRWWGLFAPRRLTPTESVEFVLNITERVQAEEQRDLLLAELNHRVKNMFAVIRALAMQGKEQRTAAEFQDIFLGRLDALVRAHNLVFEGEWRSVALSELADRTLRPYATTCGRSIVLEGQAVKVDPKRALSLSLVLHELATNAAKYGALSVPDGQVRLSWRVVDQQAGPVVQLEWTEIGGPEVERPSGSGFGTQLISRVFDYELDGEAALEFAPEGLRLTASFRPA